MNQNLTRVSSRIANTITDFCKGRSTFRMDDLRKYVVTNIGPVAPASPDRILRQLRSQGKVNYKVLSRRDSLYQVLLVA